MTTPQKTYIEQAIQKAGWDVENIKNVEALLLTPIFWQSLGKALGWPKKGCIECGFRGRYDDFHGDCGKCLGRDYKGWQAQWHRFIDHLAEGKDAESFFASILKK